MKDIDEKTLEIESLRSKNHILEEKLKLLSTKLEIAQKDSEEKDVMLKKLTFTSQTHAEDSQIFHELTLEIQRQAQMLQDFSMFDPQIYNNFSGSTMFMKENVREKEENFKETLREHAIEHGLKENIEKLPIVKENIAKAHVSNENTKENTHETSIIKEINENQEKKHEVTPGKLNEKKEIVREPVPFNKFTGNISEEVEKEKSENQEIHQNFTDKIEKSKEASPLKKQDAEKKIENIENPVNAIAFPPPPPPVPAKDNANNLKNKKLEENTNNIKKNTNRAFAPASFNHPKFNNRPPQQPIKSNAETLKPFSSSKMFFNNQFLLKKK